MRTPRYQQVSPIEPQCVHVTSRCVQRAFLCGDDPLTGHNYDHRRQWIEAQIMMLSEHFAVAVYAYAVMSNHFHLLMYMEPLGPTQWSDEDVARRWLAVTSTRRTPLECELELLIEDKARIADLRERLGSLSWFMRYLKEPIARRANKEVGSRGHFWEARYDVKDTLDDEALLSQMVYIDLNPARAGISDEPTDGPFTSLAIRVHSRAPEAPLTPIAGCLKGSLPEMTESDYRAIVAWTLALKTASPIPPPKTVSRLNLDAETWALQVDRTETAYAHAVGSLESLTAHAERLGKRTIRGIGFRRRLTQPPTNGDTQSHPPDNNA